MTGLWVLWVLYCLALLIDLLYVQPWRQRIAASHRETYESGAFSFGLRAALPVFSLLLLVRTFLFDVYHVPTGSMRPLLDEGSRIWVNRLAYGLRSPLTGEALLGELAPAPGDVVVFQYPREPTTTYVKRVIAVPGDEITIQGDHIRINGRALFDLHDQGPLRHAAVGAVEFTVIESPPSTDPPIDIELTVPEGHYFTLGDNLGNSEDSRVWGLLEARNLLGRVVL